MADPVVVNLNVTAGTTYIMQPRPARAAGRGNVPPAIPAGGYTVVDQANPGVPLVTLNAGETLNLAGAGSGNLIIRPNGNDVPRISATSNNNTINGVRTTNQNLPLARITGGTLAMPVVPAELVSLTTQPATRTTPASYVSTARDTLVSNNADTQVQTVTLSGQGNNGMSNNNGRRIEVGDGATLRMFDPNQTRPAPVVGGGTLPIRVGATTTNNVQVLTIVGGNDNFDNNRQRAGLASGRAASTVADTLNVANTPAEVTRAVEALQARAAAAARRPGGGRPGFARPGGREAEGGPQATIDTYITDTLRPNLRKQGLPELLNTGPVRVVPLPVAPTVDTPIAARVDEMDPGRLRDAVALVDPSLRGNPSAGTRPAVEVPTGIPNLGGGLLQV
jgi:hypothetical protein